FPTLRSSDLGRGEHPVTEVACSTVQHLSRLCEQHVLFAHPAEPGRAEVDVVASVARDPVQGRRGVVSSMVLKEDVWITAQVAAVVDIRPADEQPVALNLAKQF